MGPGDTVDRYRIDAELAAGGFGAVYRAHHIHTQRAVAIKLLDPALASDPRMLIRFKREAQILAAIQSAHVVQVLDWGVLPEGDSYLVMELLAGCDLRTLLKRGPIELAHALTIGRQILAGLSAAHERGIVHRDLKPANVFLAEVDGGEVVKLIDFGISKRQDAGALDAFRTETNHVMGTAGFMAPEQVRGLPVDERTDVFSAGVVLYQMLTRQLPFPAETYEDYVIQVCSERAIAIEGRVPQLPPHVIRAVMRALEPDPAARWRSASELSGALDGALELPGSRTKQLRSPRPPGDVASSATQPTAPVIEVLDDEPPSTIRALATSSQVARDHAPRATKLWLGGAIVAMLATGGVVAGTVASRDDAAPEPRERAPIAQPAPGPAIAAPVEAPGEVVAAPDAGVPSDAAIGGGAAIVASPDAAVKPTRRPDRSRLGLPLSTDLGTE